MSDHSLRNVVEIELRRKAYLRVFIPRISVHQRPLFITRRTWSRWLAITARRAADTLISRRYSPYPRRRQRTLSVEKENGRSAI